MDDCASGSMLHQNIREARKQKGLSQAELANLLNVSRQTISNWETGLSVPDVLSMSRLQQYLNYPVEKLLGCEELSQPTDDTNPMTKQEIAKELAKYTTFYASEIERRKHVEKIALILFGVFSLVAIMLLIVRFLQPVRVEIVTDPHSAIRTGESETTSVESLNERMDHYTLEQFHKMPAEALLNIFIEHGLELDDNIASLERSELARVFKGEFDLFIQGTTALNYSGWNDLAKQVQKIYLELTE